MPCRTLLPWIRSHGHALGLGTIISAAAGVSLIWVFLVPIFQSPDEPVHFDYAMSILEHKGLFRVPKAVVAQGIMDSLHYHHFPFIYYQLHPYTRYLSSRSELESIAFNSAAKVPPGYGTRAYFRDLEHQKPASRRLFYVAPPSLAYYYPFGYYGLLALWLALLGLFSSKLVVLFFGARIFSTILLVISLLFIAATLRHLGLGRLRSLLLTAVIALFPLSSFVCSFVQPDNLSLTLVSACLYFCVRFRNEPAALRHLACLGVVLAALAVTKAHYFLASLVPALAMIAAELWFQRARLSRWLISGALVLTPIALAWSIYLATIWELDYHPLAMAANLRDAGPVDRIAIMLGSFKRALADHCSGGVHRSFWGVFGWLDTPLVFKPAWLNALIQGLLQAAACVFLVLTLVRLERVASRIYRVARKGRSRWAVRIACSNPLMNSYFLFTLIMFALYVRTNNYFGWQGRNWLPLILPVFLTGTVYAPRALSLRVAQRAVAALSLAALVAYSLAGSYFAIASVRARYYPPGRAAPMEAVALPRQPTYINQMRWHDNAGDGLGDDPYLVFQLDRPRYVYCVRLRFVLTNPGYNLSTFQAFWMQSGKTQLSDEPSPATYRLCARDAEQTLTVWINQPIDVFRIDPDVKPCHFELREMTALARPETGTELARTSGEDTASAGAP
jgi:hypothetical protein